MKHRVPLLALTALVASAYLATTAAAQQAASDWSVPTTSFGHPDLQGN